MNNDLDLIIVKCPHCESYVTVLKNEINCAIFRHAIFKDTFIPIDPHSTLQECEKLLSENKIFGCAKPFQIKFINNIAIAFKCEYI